MEPLSARMDFEFDPLPEGFGARVEELVNAELAGRPADRGRRSCPATTAVEDEDLIRTKVSLDPRVGARDPRRRHRRPRQAGRRRHPRRVAPPRSAGSAVVKTESKGKGNKRIRIEVVDA